MAVTKASYYQRQVKKGKITQSDYNRIMSTPAKGKSPTVKKSSSAKRSSSFDPYAGLSWEAAAEKAKRAGVDISTGSDFDMMMNKKYNRENYYRLGGGEAEDQEAESLTPKRRASYIESQRPSNRSQRPSNREKASKAYNVFNDLLGINTAKASSERPSPGIVQPTFKKNTSGILGNIFNAAVAPASSLYHLFDRAMPDLGLSEYLGINKDMPGGLVYNISDQPGEYIDNEGNVQTINPSNPNSPFYTEPTSPGYNGPPAPAPYANWNAFNRSQGNSYNNRTDTRRPSAQIVNDNVSIVDNQDYAVGDNQIDNQPYIPQNSINSAPPQTGGGTMPKMFGSGSWGNGAGATNMNLSPSDQAYIKQMRKSVSGDFGMKDAKKQLEAALNQIMGNYNIDLADTKKNIQEQNNQNLMNLMSLFGAYGTSDSEQRMQAQERANDAFLQSLASAKSALDRQKAEDINSTKSKYADVFSQIGQRKQSAQDQLAKLIYDMQSQAEARSQKSQPRMYISNTTKAPGRNEIFNWVEDALNQGGSWEEIAQQAQAQGIPTYTGSYLDELLKNAAKQNRYRN